MTKKNYVLIAVAIILATLYVIYFTDWFKPKTFRIYDTTLKLPDAPRRHHYSMSPLLFGFNRPLKLTEIKVVPLAEYQTNQHVLPLWHLVSDSNSVPEKMIHYGIRIGGMKPAVAGQHAEPLESNTVYRIIVSAGDFTGEHDFELGGKVEETNSASH